MKKDTDITPRRLSNIIEKVKLHLVERMETEGLCENFGQAEVKMLEDHYINHASGEDSQNKKRNLVNIFDIWVTRFINEGH